VTTWPDPDNSAIDRYLGQLRFRDPTNRTRYRHILLDFQERVTRRPASEVSRDDLEAWLREGGGARCQRSSRMKSCTPSQW